MSRLREWLQRLAGTFGGLEAQRDQRGFAWLDIMGRDLRYAARSLLCDRGSVALAVVALSLGIGATTAIFSVGYSVFIAASHLPIFRASCSSISPRTENR